MAATCLDVIQDALQEIGEYAAGETASSDDAAFCMGRLQSLINSFLGTTTAYATSDALPHADSNAFMYELAKVIAPGFGAKLDALFVKNWQEAHNRLKAALHTPVVTEADGPVLYLSRQYGRNWF